MSISEKTHAELIAEQLTNIESLGDELPAIIAAGSLRKLLEQLDAAHKREISERVTRAVKNTKKIIAEQTVGNAAKLREAVGYILKYADSVACRDHDEHTRHYIDQIRKWAQSAISAPARNCDVGTAAEQTERYCRELPFPPEQGDSEFWGYEHLLKWAQLPYESEVAK